jgi:hypothetical protein
MGRGDSMATSKPGWMFTRSRLRLIGTSLGGTDHRPIQQPQVMMMMMMMMGLRRAMSTAAAEVGVKEESMRRVLIKALDATKVSLSCSIQSPRSLTLISAVGKVTVEDISGGQYLAN